MTAVFKHPGIIQPLASVLGYWLLLFAVSVYRPSLSFALPALLIAGLPLLTLASRALWRAANARAYLDDLTGLKNRRAFAADATALLRKSRPGVSSLILIDIDGMKGFNDECGHQTGDELLEHVAAHLAAVTDQVYRLGGDEFAILVDRAQGYGVTALLKSLSPLVRRFRTCGHEHLVQFSYGYASMREGETFEQFFQRADGRLRQFKSRLYGSGRPAASTDGGIVSIFAHRAVSRAGYEPTAGAGG